MASWEDVRRIAAGLPGTSEVTSRGSAQWRVGNRNFSWERGLHKTDLAALGEAAPKGPILGVRVADLGVKEALLADDPDVYFTIPHFDGYPAVLVLLDRIKAAELHELMVEAWLDRAPKQLAKAYQEQHPNVS
ncbi:MmcQ/YjbR family DNA-binding protein [Streptacidiphilus sp. PAMC 29251]